MSCAAMWRPCPSRRRDRFATRGARRDRGKERLGLLHRRVNHPWTLAELASEVGVSRSALVERFTRYLSEPPMTYLARWRLRLRPAQALARTPNPVAEISSGVGYESEAAFNRGFKRRFGLLRRHDTGKNRGAPRTQENDTTGRSLSI